MTYVDPEDTYFAAYVLRMDASSGAMTETVFSYDEVIEPLDIAAAPGGGSVVLGRQGGDFYIAGFGSEGQEVFSRLLNLGTAAISDVAVTSTGEIVLAGYTRSGSGLPLGAFVLWLDGGTGEVLSSIDLGSSGHRYATAVAVGPGDDVYVTGAGFIVRISENRAPDCSRSTASPSVIWPPNGRMIPVSILGVTDPEGDAVALKVTGISQDEPGAAFSGIGPGLPHRIPSHRSLRRVLHRPGDGVRAARPGQGQGELRRQRRVGFVLPLTLGGPSQ